MSETILWLENATTKVGFSAQTGALVAFEDIADDWSILRRPELGLSFRLLLPLPDRRNNSAFGIDQDAPDVATTDTEIAFTWASVRSRFGGTHDIRVVQRFKLVGRHLSTNTRIENGSDGIVENVYSPYLGDVQPSQDDGSLESISHDYGAGTRQALWPHFSNTLGYYGVDVPTQLVQGLMPSYGTPTAPFRLIQGDGHGLYMGVETNSTELVAWFSELWPGYGDSLESSAPETRKIAGKPVTLQLSAVHVPYIQPGESRDLTPIAIETYAGDWHAGADIYAAWRDTWITRATPPAWAAEPHSWQQIQINSPEDELRLNFEDFVDVGREAAAAGVRAIQLVGFNEGGQDRNNPSHAPEPRLGGFDALRDAIAQVQALGVKVVLFAKFNWADRSTQAFREHFIQDAIKDPYGDYYLHPGYKYETVTQLLDINTRRLIPMCFLYERYLEECERQFKILVDLGADGMLFDECLHHLPTLLCFDESHGHRYGAPTYANDRELIRRLARIAPAGFLYAGEAIYDWQFDAYSVSYHRSENRHHFPLHRYTQPRGQFMTAVTGFDDRNMINQCLVYRYIISYEPFNFKGRLTDYPETVAYGQRMDALRAEARGWLWDGLFTDTVGATVTTIDGAPHEPYSVFTHKDGTRAVIIANYDSKAVTCSVEVEGHGSEFFARTIDDESWQPADGAAIEIPARGAVALLPRDPDIQNRTPE